MTLDKMDEEDLNREVTLAILEAEEADRACRKKWERVAEVEEALSKVAKVGSVDHRVAEQGALWAKARVELIKKGWRTPT